MPIPLLLAAAPAIAQTAGGLFQTLFSGKNKAQNQLETTLGQNPMYKGSKSVGDYYNEALNRYNVSPYQSTQYQVAKQNAERGTATGINALQGRGGAMGGISRLIGIQNDALLRAGAGAEQQRNQNFGQLGGAASMKASDDRYKFENNESNPYNRRLQMGMMKAGAANARFDAGLTNLFGGLSNASTLLNGTKK